MSSLTVPFWVVYIMRTEVNLTALRRTHMNPPTGSLGRMREPVIRCATRSGRECNAHYMSMKSEAPGATHSPESHGCAEGLARLRIRTLRTLCTPNRRKDHGTHTEDPSLLPALCRLCGFLCGSPANAPGWTCMCAPLCPTAPQTAQSESGRRRGAFALVRMSVRESRLVASRLTRRNDFSASAAQAGLAVATGLG